MNSASQFYNKPWILPIPLVLSLTLFPQSSLAKAIAKNPVLQEKEDRTEVTMQGKKRRQQTVIETQQRDRKRDDDVERIRVTGSNIHGTGFIAASPITIVSADDLEKSSPSTLAAALNNLPALVAEGGPNATSGQRTAGRNYLNLRGIGEGRTLVLVNGRRFPGSAPGGTVDTNLIPQALVSRVEVVTGGASAAYGSDAVAGVVNFILDNQFEGFKANASLGLSEQGDGFRNKLAATWGDGFLKDRLHFAVSGEYYQSQAIEGDAREHRVKGANMIPNPDVTQDTATAENPLNIVVPNAREVGSFGGLITQARVGRRGVDSSLVGNYFNSDGQFLPYDFGTFTSDAGYQNGGDGVNTATMQRITRPLDRTTLYTGLNYQLDRKTTIFVNTSYGRSESSNTTLAYHSGRYGMTIYPDNAFLPAAISQQMMDEGLDSLRMERWDSEYEMEVVATNRNRRVEAGFSKEIGYWFWDASVQWGQNVETAPNYNNFIPEYYSNGIDSVIDPQTGNPVCRSTLEGDSGNCVPINPFGVGSYSDEMIDYFTGTSVAETYVMQRLAQTKISGDLFDGVGAGPWAIATGIEYRYDFARVSADERSQNNGFFTNNQQGWAAERSVREGFVELNAPLYENVQNDIALTANVAGRHTNYSTSGSVNTWKLGLNFTPNKQIRLRATRSRDIRAPSHAEMFTRGRQKLATYTDFTQGNATVRNVLTKVQGNPELVPEIANTTVLGVVYQPEWLPDLAISIDRYDIKMNDAIRSLSEQAVLDYCELGFQQACNQVIRDADGNLSEVRNSNFNLDELRLTGWDAEARYRTEVGAGKLTLKAHVGHMKTLKLADSNGNQVDRAGESATPHWRALTSVKYKQGAYSGFFQGRYTGSNVIDVTRTATEYEYNNIPAAWYFDAQIGYEYSENINVYLNIQNITDKAPVFAPQDGTYLSPTDPNVYDQIGRYYVLGVRVDY